MATTAFDTFVGTLRQDDSPLLSPEKVATALHLQMQDLAALARVHRNTIRAFPEGSSVQESLRDIVRVLSAAAEVNDDVEATIFWFRNHPIPSFQHKTAETLVREGQTEAVVSYLASIEAGFSG